jgi:hypothetical protein
MSFFIWCYALVCIGVWTRLIPVAIFGPQPKQTTWAMFCIFGSGTFIAGSVAWRVYWSVDKKVFPRRGARNSGSSTA